MSKILPKDEDYIHTIDFILNHWGLANVTLAISMLADWDEEHVAKRFAAVKKAMEPRGKKA